MRPEVITRKFLRDTGAVISNGHFVYTSGDHGDVYLDKAAVTRDPLVASSLCHMLAEEIGIDPRIQVVVAPAVGAIALGQWVAFYLTELNRGMVESVYAEKEGEEFVLRRGYGEVVRGKNVAIVEDILTTGGSARQVVAAVEQAGGLTQVVATICNRGGVRPEDFGRPVVPRLVSLLDVTLNQWPASACPLCQKGVPINTEFGHGAEFLAHQRS